MYTVYLFILKLLIGSEKVYSYFGEGTSTLPRKIDPTSFSFFFFLKLELKGSDFPYLPSSAHIEASRGVAAGFRYINTEK